MLTAIRLVDPSQDAQLAELEQKARRPSHFFRAMAHRPEVLKAFPALYGAIMGPGTVDRRLKELAYLTVSYANECPYCTAAHTATGRKAGISDEEMRALQTEQDHTFNETERAVVRYARELTRTAEAGETANALAEHFGDEQIVEITLVVAMANFTNRFNNGLGIQPEQG